MKPEKALRITEELTQLLDYQVRLERALALATENETQSVLEIRLNKLRPVPIAQRKVLDNHGNEIENFPEQYKHAPFLIIPQARLEKVREFQEAFNFELRTDFLLTFLLHLRGQLIERIRVLRNELNHGH
jgi:hypothetical protein